MTEENYLYTFLYIIKYFHLYFFILFHTFLTIKFILLYKEISKREMKKFKERILLKKGF